MAACGSLQHIFEKPLPENPTLLESLSSWNQINPHAKPIEESSFTEIFGELHFKEKPRPPPLPPPPCSFPISSAFYSPPPPSTFVGLLNPEIDFTKNTNTNDKLDSFSLATKKPYSGSCHRKGESFSSMNYESLQLCTEGLGFESSGDVEDMKNDLNCEESQRQRQQSITRHSVLENSSGEAIRRSRTRGRSFPPPISCIGTSGKPSVCFRSYRQNGRFVLKEVRIPTHEFLHASREDGRLKLQFVQPNEGDALEEDRVEDVGVEEEDSSEDSEHEESEELCSSDDDDDG